MIIPSANLSSAAHYRCSPFSLDTRYKQKSCGKAMSRELVALQLGQCGNQVTTQADTCRWTLTPVWPVQLGAEWFTSLGREVLQSPGGQSGTFFRAGAGFSRRVVVVVDRPAIVTLGESGRQVARAVLVDMEPKAIATAHAIAKESGTWCPSPLLSARAATRPTPPRLPPSRVRSYDPRSVLHAQSGSGNNWAQGSVRQSLARTWRAE
jgi:hypothetical protein